MLSFRRLITARMPEGKYFFIKSQLNGLVLDICAGSRDPGTAVITWPKKDSQNDNQLWYVDHVTGTIRSKMHHLCLDVNGEVQRSDGSARDIKLHALRFNAHVEVTLSPHYLVITKYVNMPERDYTS